MVAASKYERALVKAGCFLSCLAMWIGPSSAQQLPFTHYTPNGERIALPSAEVHKVYQDGQGFIWMAAFSSGLVRYDGHVVETYTTDDGLRDMGIWDVGEDTAGRLWVASNGGLVISALPLDAYKNGERIRFTNALDGVPLATSVVGKNATGVDREGRLWVGTGSIGIVRYGIGEAPRADTIALGVPGHENPAVRSLVARRDGSVWAGTRTGQLFIFRSGNDTFHILDEADGVPAGDIRTLYESPSGRLYMGVGDGSVYEVTDNATAIQARLLARAPGGSIFSIHAATGNRLWVATQGAGALAIDADGVMRVSKQAGLLSDQLFDVMQDREGNIWFAQLGGVSKLRYNHMAFSAYTATSTQGVSPVLPSPAVGAVEIVAGPDVPCPIWAATQEGIACIQHDGTSVVLGREDGLASEWVNALSYDADGRLWIGTLKGIYSLSAPQLPALPNGKVVGSVSIAGRSMLLTEFGSQAILSIRRAVLRTDSERQGTESVWFAGNRELILFADGRWSAFRQSAGLPATVLHSAEVDADGYVWVGTRDRGLFRSIVPVSLERLRGYETRSYRAEDGGDPAREIVETLFEPVWSIDSGASSNEVLDLRADGGSMWVGSPFGLVLLDRASIEPKAHLTMKDGLKADNVLSLAQSEDGFLWAGTNAGLAQIDRVRREVVRTVTKQDGLVDDEVWFLGSVRVGKDGAVYYGTAQGLSIYRPQLHLPNAHPPVARIRKARFTQDTNGRNELAIGYAGLSFADERRVLYKTRLVGYDASWTEPKSDIENRYTNLRARIKPKQYRFEVLASNSDGLWTAKPASFVFFVDPPWWLQWWAIVSYALLIAGSASVLIRFERDRLIRKEGEKAAAREAGLRLQAAVARSEAAEAAANALAAENERKESELEKARELSVAYQELRRTQDQLIEAEKLASLGQFAAGVAHEIKNPLNFINNFAGLSVELLDDLKAHFARASSGAVDLDWDEVGGILDDLSLNASKIQVHGGRADGIVRSMISHAEGYSGHREEIEINELTSSVLQIALQELDGSVPRVVIERDFGDGVGRIHIVAQELARVLLNLIDNAVYAARDHRNGSSDIPRVLVRTRNHDGGVTIAVSDNGGGIPGSIRKRIFEPFFTTKPTGTGVGLGLSLCHSIITRGYGGRLEFESRPGEGATFTVWIPRETTRASIHRRTLTSDGNKMIVMDGSIIHPTPH